MAQWTSITDASGHDWLVNYVGLLTLVRQSVYADLIMQRSRITTSSQDGISVFRGPILVQVETDFGTINRERDGLSQTRYRQLTQQLAADGMGTLAELVRMVRATGRERDQFRRLQQLASDQTMQNVDKSVALAQAGIAVAKSVRDLAATTLVVGASFLSGGAAAAVLGGGSALKGVARYQTTGNVGAGVIEASATFVVGLIQLAPNLAQAGEGVLLTERAANTTGMKAGGRMALVLVGAQTDAGFETAKSVMDGESVKTALLKGGIRFATDAATGGAGIGLDAIRVMGKIGIPVGVRLISDTGMTFGSDRAVDAAGGQEQQETAHMVAVPPHLHAVRDCHYHIAGVGSDQAYVQSLALKAA